MLNLIVPGRPYRADCVCLLQTVDHFGCEACEQAMTDTSMFLQTSRIAFTSPEW